MTHPVRDAIALVTQALTRLQEAMDLQEQRAARDLQAVRQQVQEAERRTREALQRQAHDAERKLQAALLLQEQRAQAALREAVRQTELKLRERDAALRNPLQPRSETRGQEETQATCDVTNEGAALQRLEDRLEKVETYLQQAMDTFLPKVDQLLRRFGETPPPNAPPSSPLVAHTVARPPALTFEPNSLESSAESEGETRVQHVLDRIRASQERALHARNFPSRAGEELCAAADEGQLESVRNLLDSGADVNYTNADGDTPLLRALCNEVLPEMVTLLLQRGADPNIVDCAGASPLHVAAQNDVYWQYAVQLVGRGADVNARDENGSTPLHWAANAGNESAVRTLLRAGARKDLRAWQGWEADKTPFDLARDSQDLRDMLRP